MFREPPDNTPEPEQSGGNHTSALRPARVKLKAQLEAAERLSSNPRSAGFVRQDALLREDACTQEQHEGLQNAKHFLCTVFSLAAAFGWLAAKRKVSKWEIEEEEGLSSAASERRRVFFKRSI